MTLSAPEQPSDSERVIDLADEIEALVARGTETTRFEFTVQCSLAGTDRRSQVDFAKTIQGIANCLPPEDRVYVVGADQKNKTFSNLKNSREFDSANISQILAKYLDPVPNFQSYSLLSRTGQNYVAVFIPALQRRPIMAKSSLQASDGRTDLLRTGEIWIKKNTGLQLATRADIEAMYETRIESESERRAQQRLALTRDGMEAAIRIRSTSERQTPTEDLVLGPDVNYEAYLEQIIATDDLLRFRMLLTVLRRCLIEQWHSFNAFGSYSADPNHEAVAKLSAHFTDIFQPSLRRLLHTGLLLLEHESTTTWFENTARLLVATFKSCFDLEAFSRDTRMMIGVELVGTGRLLATYALRMNRYAYLPSLLKQTVTPIGRSEARERTEPFVFWPIRRNVAGRDRIAYAWQHDVQPYWLRFFGSQKSFVDAAARLEFINELNSHVGTQIDSGRGWIESHYPGLDMSYVTDLWRYPIDACVPIAEQVVEGLWTSPDSQFILNISVIHGAFQEAFPPAWSPGLRVKRFIDWLQEFRKWRYQASVNTLGLEPSEPDWGPIIRRHMTG